MGFLGGGGRGVWAKMRRAGGSGTPSEPLVRERNPERSVLKFVVEGGGVEGLKRERDQRELTFRPEENEQ